MPDVEKSIFVDNGDHKLKGRVIIITTTFHESHYTIKQDNNNNLNKCLLTIGMMSIII